MHELGHGLGFLASADTVSETELGLGFGGRLIIYDRFLETEATLPLANPSIFTNPSPALLEAATMNDLVFNGPEAVRENGARVPIFAPIAFDIGSSVSHLDERAFRAGSENALMTPFLSAGEAVHNPGPVTLGIFADMGWPLNFDVVSARHATSPLLNFFPNPTFNDVTIVLPPGGNASKVQLFDLRGRQVLSRSIAPNQVTLKLEVATLAPGTYLIRYLGKEAMRTGRLVVN
jgi:hypothetical protein